MCDAAAWKPTRKPYVPTWMRSGGDVYGEMQKEYSAYADQQTAKDAGVGSSADDDAATRDPEEMMSIASSWAHAIELACGPVHYLCVADTTDGHAIEGAKVGRALHATGRELQVLVVSSRFCDMSRRERQQIINAVLSDDLKSGALHSVQMRCWAPDEWAEQGSPVDLGTPCSYSSTAGQGQGPLQLGQSLPLPSCSTPPSRGGPS